MNESQHFKQDKPTKSIFVRLLKQFVVVLGIAYVGTCVVLWAVQEHFIFHPVSYDIELDQSAEKFEVVVDAQNAITLRGYILNSTLPGPVILFFAGNGGDALGYASRFRELAVPTVLSNYRGYGKSDGTPAERTMLADAKILLETVQQKYPDRPLLLMGNSLGSAVAIRTTHASIAGVILISPFRSLVHVASTGIMRIFPIEVIMRHRFDTRGSLDLLPDKVLVLYSNADRTISSRETEHLLEHIPHADVRIDNVHHDAILVQNVGFIRVWLEENFIDSRSPTPDE